MARGPSLTTAAWRALGVVTLLAPQALALYEDQAGKIDWGLQNIGRLTHSLFQSIGTQRLALTATDQGVVAGIDLRTGSTVWRQVLPEEERVVQLVSHNKALLSLGASKHGGSPVAVARLWTAQGSLVWDAVVEGGGAAAVPVARIEDQAVIVAHGAVVVALRPSDGGQLWRWTADTDAGETHIDAAFGSEPADGAEAGIVQVLGRVLTTSGQTKLLEATIKAADGTTLSSKLVEFQAPPSTQAVVSHDQSMYAALTADGQHLLLHQVGGGGKVKAHPLSAVIPAGSTLDGAALLPLSLPMMFCVRLPSGASALLKVVGGKLTLERLNDGAPHTLTHTTSRDGKALLAVVSTTAAAITLEVLAIEADGTGGEWTAPEALAEPQLERGGVASAWLNSYTRKDGSSGHRLLVSTKDAALQLLQATKEGARSSWVREEALASVTGAELVPLPSLAVEVENAQPFFGFALHSVVESLQTRLSELAAGPKAASESAAEKAALHGDAYGTRQAVILRTAASKVFGLHSGSGAVLWSRFIAPESPTDTPPELLELIVCGSGVTQQVELIAQDAGSWRLISLQPWSGKVIAEKKFAGKLVHVTKLPFSTTEQAAAAHEDVLMLVDDQLGVSVHPATDAAMEMLRAHAEAVFFYIADGSEISGYGLEPSQGRVRAELRWRMQLPTASQLEIATFPHEAAVGSPVRIKGDRSVLHKYINRNLVALGMVTAEGEPGVQVMLLDSVSGRLLHTARHSGCVGPVRMLLGEHWLLYSYWSPSAHQHLITVSELFTNSTVSDDVVSLVMAGPVDYSRHENMFDSYSASLPHVMSQSYAFATSIATMGVSLSRAGITPKQVLLATDAGELLALDKRLFDPRRPHIHPSKMTQADKEEGLLPYAPSLGAINPLSIISHHHQIARPRKIRCAPTMLESTTLVFTYGIDLFLTRVAPAREFDRLNEDFNFVALVGATAFLAVATMVSYWYSGKQDLAKAWR